MKRTTRKPLDGRAIIFWFIMAAIAAALLTVRADAQSIVKMPVKGKLMGGGRYCKLKVEPTTTSKYFLLKPGSDALSIGYFKTVPGKLYLLVRVGDRVGFIEPKQFRPNRKHKLRHHMRLKETEAKYWAARRASKRAKE